MTIDILKRGGLFLILSLAQALLFNRIQLFGCAMPLLYVFFVITFPLGQPRWSLLLWSFSMGFVTDMFANTPGVASFSLTLLGALQPYLLGLFVESDTADMQETSAVRMGWGKFFGYSLLMVAVYCLVFFAVEAFSFSHWQHWLGCFVGSTALTAVLVLTLESLRQ